MAISITKPTIGGSEDTWGAQINTALDAIVDTANGTSGTMAPNLSTLTINGTAVTATAAELNTLDGVTATTAEINTLNGLTATTAELNKLDGYTGTATDLNEAVAHYVPSGGIIMWSGTVAAIPTGWYLCDGNNGTPDLVDRFIVGSSTDSGATHDIGDTGGTNSLTLVSGNIPSHTHSFSATTASGGSHTHTYSGTTSNKSLTGTLTAGKPQGYSGIVSLSSGSVAGGGDGSQSSANTYSINASHDHTYSGTTASNGSHTHTVSGTTGSTGSGSAFDNRPAYYALAFIMKA